jgi:hypothetical protein
MEGGASQEQLIDAMPSIAKTKDRARFAMDRIAIVDGPGRMRGRVDARAPA